MRLLPHPPLAHPAHPVHGGARKPTRRAALAALLLGTAGVAVWQWQARAAQGSIPSANLPGVGGRRVHRGPAHAVQPSIRPGPGRCT